MHLFRLFLTFVQIALLGSSAWAERPSITVVLSERPLMTKVTRVSQHESLVIASARSISATPNFSPKVWPGASPFIYTPASVASGWRRTMPPDPPITPKSVLSYLRDMVERCHKAHRLDLETDYQDAWELAASAIYGPLPRRLQSLAIPPTPGEIIPRPLTPGQREAIQRPWRKIIARDGDDEILECGHRVWYAVQVPGSPAARRRRCKECAAVEEAKKPAAAVSDKKAKAVRA